MTSREEFMRQLGISTDDIVDPASVKTRYVSKQQSSNRYPSEDNSPPSATTKGGSISSVRSGSTSGGQSSFSSATSSSSVPMKRDYSTPVVAPSRNSNATPVYHAEKENSVPRPKAAGVAGMSFSAREEFLRSLGIDNMDTPQGVAPVAQQAPPVPPRASQEYLKKNIVAAAAISSQDDDYESPSNRLQAHQAQSDITLGHRRSSKPATVSYSAPTSTSMSSDVAETSNVRVGMTEKEDLSVTVDQLKTEGNKAFEDGDFRKAVRAYTKAIDRDPSNAALYSNRSAAYLQAAKQMGIDTRAMSLRDSEKVIDLRPDWFKGYSRKGDALFKLERFSEAATAYERALALEPDNMNLMHSLGEARNAAGNVGAQRGMTAWSTAPQAVESLSAKKSASELLEDMKRNMQKESKECILVGNDFRELELQKFRESRAQVTSRTKSSSSFSSASVSSVDPAKPQLDKSAIPEEFSGDAAAAYQRSFLEQYRAKKAAKQQQEFSKYM